MLMGTDLLHWLGFDYLATPGNRIYWPFLISALLIGIAYQRWRKLPSFLSSTIWWHQSARQDYLLFMLLSLSKLTLLAAVLPEIQQFIWWGLQLWQTLFGFRGLQPAAWWVNVLFTLTLFIFSDLSRYWLHRWMHTSRWLWPIHRLHHSAEVLTPFTFYRIHPLESLLFGLRYALVTGLVTSLFIYWFGFGLQAHQWLGSLVIVAIMNIAGSNLRHSQLPLSYWPWLQKILISPAQHQWHHNRTGTDQNYGSILAIWDWWFGSLRITRYDDPFDFGVGKKGMRTSLFRLLLLRS
ncbi:Fatty acid hydroxylase superfamily protein [Marinobacterium sp. xm-a-152]|nr:Fatty acid hydroxylase superfamily protein [Marinobacterium sp. xm-a-152]